MPDPTLSAFLEACGSAGPLRLSLKGPDTARALCRVFDQPFAVIGRAPGADLTLDHPAVSRRHAYLQLIDGMLFGVDLSSRTGTYWQDEARPMGWLRPGHSLRIGPYRIGRWGDPPSSAADTEDEPPSPVSRLYEPPDLVTGTLEFLDPSVEPSTWVINQSLVLLGRSPACKVQLSGPGVSKLHASLVRTPQGIWLIDLLGRGGILVNGASVRCVRLDDGDTFQIGPHRVRLRYAPAPDHPDLRPDLLPAAWPESAAGTNGLLATIEPAQVVALREMPAEAVLVPLVRELGQMQQQMADQFQHALLKMFEMFSGMHQEQMGLIRQQLDELTRLSQEQQNLQEALARPFSTAVSPEPRPAADPVPPAPYRRGADRPRPARSEPPSPPRPRPESVRNDIHSDLVSRLAAIQQERESRWQKLIRSVLGGER